MSSAKRPTVEPTPFGAARAHEIWAKRGTQNTLPALTPGEDAYIWRLWDAMPGNTCWMDAFYSVLQGDPGAHR